MLTKDVLRDYFDRLARRADWEALLGDKFQFTSYTSPVKEVVGKAPFLEATKRFYSSIQSFEVRDLLVEGARGCALTRYQLRSPNGTLFQSDVAELFTVRNAQIEALAIYFDTAPFPK
jgi:ketosteroid isomerase-like protein